jgi:putative oxidoreductase
MNWRNLLIEPTIRPGNWAALPLRIVVGIIFAVYGFDKLFNNNQIFGMDVDFFRNIGIPFPELNVSLIGALELFGGLALLAGSFTKLFAFFMAGNMAVAMLTAHDYPFEGSLCMISVALLLLGGGPASLDNVLRNVGALPKALRNFFGAMADAAPRNVGWAATPLRLVMGLVFINQGLSRAFAGGASTTDLVVGIVAAVAGVMVLAGLLTKLSALVLLLIVLGDLFLGQNDLANWATYFVPGAWAAALLAIILVGPGPLSLDGATAVTLRTRSDLSTADPAVPYGR